MGWKSWRLNPGAGFPSRLWNGRVQPSIMTCSRAIFRKPEYLGVYSVYSTVWMVQGSNCSRDNNFSLLHNDQTSSGVLDFLPGLNWAGCEVNYWHPSNPEVRVELYLYSPSTPSQCWYGKLLSLNLLYLFALYKICHNPGLAVCMYQLSSIYLLHKNMNVYEF